VAVDVLIIGAGLSGLMAAHTLKNSGYTVKLIDKGRSVGGRLATRRIGDNGLADHGAQFFSVRTDTLQGYVDQWLGQDLVYVWGTGWSDGSIKRTVSDGHPRYIVKGGMNQLAKHLAVGLDIVVDTRITSIQLDGQNWTLVDNNGEVYNGRALVMTPPAPQSLNLLGSSSIQLAENDRMELSRIQFGPCLCGIHEIDGEVGLPEPGALQNFNEDIYWIADNNAKGISDAVIVTTHANAKFSKQHYDESDDNIIATLESTLQPYLKDGATITNTQVKRWRYSIPHITFPKEHLMADNLPNLVFAGDAFGGRGRIEGAFLSGISAGTALTEALG
jgi:renalase